MSGTNQGMHVLITGGAGYIGTHTCLVLLQRGYRCTVVDNLVSCSEDGLRRVREMVGCNNPDTAHYFKFYKVDLCDEGALEGVFSTAAKAGTPFDVCIHFASLKSVAESVQKPLLYYENNIKGTLNLLRLMDKHSCTNLIFSSSALVYGSAEVSLTEETPVGFGITNAYSRSKYMIEEILKDFKASKATSISKQTEDRWNIIILRYFNPVGAHSSGCIGEDPNGPPHNLMPYVAQVAVGRRPVLTVYGNDYNTPDGTGVRDFLHVMDLAEGHIAALEYMASPSFPGFDTFNLGTGRGCSVLEMIEAMRRATGHPIPYEFAPRRAGDIATCYAATEKAEKVPALRAISVYFYGTFTSFR